MGTPRCLPFSPTLLLASSPEKRLDSFHISDPPPPSQAIPFIPLFPLTTIVPTLVLLLQVQQLNLASCSPPVSTAGENNRLGPVLTGRGRAVGRIYQPMAPEFDHMGMGMGMMPMGMVGMEGPASASFPSAYVCGLPTGDAMRIDDLLDFSNQDDLFDAAAAAAVSVGESHPHHLLPLHEPSAAAGSIDTSGSNLSTFSDELCVPSEEAAELEWLSQFVDDSFSVDVPFPAYLGSCAEGGEAASFSRYNALSTDPSAIPARARSKRSRAPATALHHTVSTWSSPPPHSSPFSASPTSSSSELPAGSTNSKPKAAGAARKKETGGPGGSGMEGGVRRCTHCSSEKTPQWRTGPLGPKTLCNACGVRYKSGRLVPEYRPAASPTFVLTQHSNSHRKVMELRRQKELILRHQQGDAASPSPRPELLFRD